MGAFYLLFTISHGVEILILGITEDKKLLKETV